jgi:flavoprotein
MTFWFYRGLARGVVTTRFPRGPLDAWTADLPTAPAFRPELLTATLAARLAERCPAGAIVASERELIVDLGRCTGCGLCAAIGAGAVAPSGEFLLAATDRDAYVKRVPIRGEEAGGGAR